MYLLFSGSRVLFGKFYSSLPHPETVYSEKQGLSVCVHAHAWLDPQTQEGACEKGIRQPAFHFTSLTGEPR